MRFRGMIGAFAAAGLAVTGVTAASLASTHPVGQPEQPARYAAPVSRAAPATTCMPGEITTVARVRPGTPRAVLARLAPPPLTEFPVSGGGELAFFSPVHPPVAGNGSPLSDPAKPVMADPALQSCSYLLRDRPAARPYLRAAVSAAVSHGLAPSASRLRASLRMALIGDDPLRSGSLVVTLLANGQKVATDPLGHPVYGPYRATIAVIDRATGHVTGVGSAVWPG